VDRGKSLILCGIPSDCLTSFKAARTPAFLSVYVRNADLGNHAPASVTFHHSTQCYAILVLPAINPLMAKLTYSLLRTLLMADRSTSGRRISIMSVIRDTMAICSNSLSASMALGCFRDLLETVKGEPSSVFLRVCQ